MATTPLNPNSDPDVLPPLTIPPRAPSRHRNTLIFLHGTSTSGPELAHHTIRSLSSPPPLSTLPDPLLPALSDASNNTLPSLAEKLAKELPETRLVFPSGSKKWTTVLARESHAWFDVHSFSDRTLGEGMQVVGMKPSCEYLVRLVRGEITLIGGQGEGEGEVVLVGFSQGAAMLSTLFLSGLLDPFIHPGKVVRIILMSGWLPFRLQIWNAITTPSLQTKAEKRRATQQLVRDLLGLKQEEEKEILEQREQHPWDRLKVLIMHGKSDEKVLERWVEEEVAVLRELGVDCTVTMIGGVGHEVVEEEVGMVRNVVEGRQ